MPRISGVRCEECPNTKLEGSDIGGWFEIYTATTARGVEIYLGPGADPENNDTLETRYLCSAAHLFDYIGKLLKIDPTEKFRNR